MKSGKYFGEETGQTLVKTAKHLHCVPGEPGFHLEAYASSCLNLLYSLK